MDVRFSRGTANGKAERTDTLRRIQLVPSNTEEVNGQFIHRDRNLSYRLSAVRMHNTASRVNTFGNGRHWLNGSHLILSENQRAQSNRTLRHAVRIDSASGIDTEMVDQPTSLGEPC